VERGWLAHQVEKTRKKIETMPNGLADVEHARKQAEEMNRAEAEEYRLQRELRDRLKRP
jgi:hypothetical protein